MERGLRSQGVFFSLVVIYAMNLLTILVTTALLSQTVGFLWLGQVLARDLWAAYAWTLATFIGLWRAGLRRSAH